MGGGHIMRCLTLAKRLAVSGWYCIFAVNSEAVRVVPALKRSNFEIVISHENALAEDLGALFPEGAELLVMDHYGLDAAFESSCRGWAKAILVVDDLADRSHECDLLLDTTPGRAGESYQGLVPHECQLLLGPEYTLLREEFAMRRVEVLARRGQKTTIDRILVSFGLTDPSGVTAHAVQGVLESGASANVDVVLSPTAPAYERVASLARQNEKLRLFNYVNDMSALMAKADLALGAAGTTSWECCCLGLPTLFMVAADNQQGNAEALEAAGAAVSLGPADKVAVQVVARAVASLAEDRERYQAISRAATKMCDGLGATRVALAVHSPTKARDGKSVSMRLARAEDMEIMFEWQTHPETRRFARNPEPPTRVEHEAWFERKMADADCEMLMILHEGRDAGIFRLDRLKNGAQEVTIVVAPMLWGRGIGSAALEFANGFWPHETLHAEILPGNEVSLRMFSAAGYEKDGETIYVRAC